MSAWCVKITGTQPFALRTAQEGRSLYDLNNNNNTNIHTHTHKPHYYHHSMESKSLKGKIANRL